MAIYTTSLWAKTPALVDLVVRRLTTGTLRVRVLEGSGLPVESFRVVVRGNPDDRPEPGAPATYTGGFYSRATRAGILEMELQVPDSAGRRLLVVMTCAGGKQEQVVRLLPGEQYLATFSLPMRGRLKGTVVDSLGNGVEHALVYFGDETVVRGDEPFKPIRMERVYGGTRTGPDGSFVLAGDGEFVTAVHPDHSPATLPSKRAGRIELGPRGSISGTLVDASGKAIEGAALRLDQDKSRPVVTTDEKGRFAFAKVEAGAHGLFADDRQVLAAVRLDIGCEFRKV